MGILVMKVLEMISISAAKLVSIPPEDNGRETDQTYRNSICLNKYQLLAEAEVHSNISKGNITLNDTSFSQSSIEKNSSNSQPSSTKKKQQPKVSSQNSYFYF